MMDTGKNEYFFSASSVAVRISKEDDIRLFEQFSCRPTLGKRDIMPTTVSLRREKRALSITRDIVFESDWLMIIDSF